ncbi:HNH endonuclease [Corynebacterium segmentosum]
MPTICHVKGCRRDAHYTRLELCHSHYHKAWTEGDLPSMPKCINCGEEVSRRNARYCKRTECIRERDRERWRSKNRRRAQERKKALGPIPKCRNCGEQLKTRLGSFCGKDGCRKEAKRQYRKEHAEEIRAYRIKNKAARRSVKVESVQRQEILERDNWTCMLCGEQISKTVMYPDPYSPSLDHIVPIAEGGDHSKANIQASHLVCNVRKGKRGSPQQLALI